MQKDYSPFTPGQPIAPEFFVGRTEQVRALLDRIYRTLSGRLEVVFIGGERGIGKTSLAQFVRWYVEQELKIVGAYVHLGGVRGIEETVRRSIERIVQESMGKSWYQRLRDLVKYIRQVDLFGVTLEFQPPPDLLSTAVRHFPQTLQQLFNALRGNAKGLLLVWDDINGLAQNKEFADWLKSVVDEAAMAKIPVSIVLVGLRRNACCPHPQQRVFGSSHFPFEHSFVERKRVQSVLSGSLQAGQCPGQRRGAGYDGGLFGRTPCIGSRDWRRCFSCR